MPVKAARDFSWRWRLLVGSLAITVITALIASMAGRPAWWPALSSPLSWSTDGALARQCNLPGAPSSAPHPGMVWVPGGRFVMGDGFYPEEYPPRAAAVDGFWMDRTEVTNAEFARFVEATGYRTEAERLAAPGPSADNGGGTARKVDAANELGVVGVFVKPAHVRGRDDPLQWWKLVAEADWRHPQGPGSSLAGRSQHPVVAVTHADALAYAHWLGRDLPTEAQWEWAARAAQARPPDAAARPLPSPPADANTWQGLFPVVNTADDGFEGLAPVGCFAPNGLGLHDMIGNVWELTRDVYRDPSPRAVLATPSSTAGAVLAQSPAGPVRRVIKGGSFLCSSDYCARYRAGARQPQEDQLATNHVGFRTVLTAPAAAAPSP